MKGPEDCYWSKYRPIKVSRIGTRKKNQKATAMKPRKRSNKVSFQGG